MSSGDKEAMMHQPSNTPVYGSNEEPQAEKNAPMGQGQDQGPAMASGGECSGGMEGGCPASGPSPSGSGQSAHPSYPYMYQGVETAGQPSCQGSESPQGGRMSDAAHQCGGQSMGPSPQFGGPPPMFSGPGPQPGMFPGGFPGAMPPRFGPNPMGPPHQPAGPGPQMNMHPGGYPGQMMPPHGSEAMGHENCQCHGGSPADGYKHEEYRHGQLIGVIQDFASGQPDVGRVMNLLQNCDTQFWKGALVGVAATVLLTNPAVKKAITDSVSGLWGVFQKESPSNAPESANE